MHEVFFYPGKDRPRMRVFVGWKAAGSFEEDVLPPAGPGWQLELHPPAGAGQPVSYAYPTLQLLTRALDGRCSLPLELIQTLLADAGVTSPWDGPTSTARYEVAPATAHGEEVIVGWDAPTCSFYLQLYAHLGDERGDEQPILYVPTLREPPDEPLDDLAHFLARTVPIAVIDDVTVFELARNRQAFGCRGQRR